MRRILTMMMAGGLSVATAGLEAQSLAQRVSAVRTGTVRFEYAAAEGVCGNGRGNISIRREGSRVATMGGANGARGREWEDECEPGPVRIALDVSRGEVTGLRSYVGGRWRGVADRDLGAVSPAVASDYLLALAESADEDVAKDAILPGTIASGVTPWARLLTIAKDERRPREVRNSAVFWLGQSRDARAISHFEEVLLPL